MAPSPLPFWLTIGTNRISCDYMRMLSLIDAFIYLVSNTYLPLTRSSIFNLATREENTNWSEVTLVQAIVGTPWNFTR